jgi:hypothetical protein
MSHAGSEDLGAMLNINQRRKQQVKGANHLLQA